MDVLLLCGYFEAKYQDEIARKTKTWVENAANTFQERLIAGLRTQNLNLTIVSAPLFGAWPTAYSDMRFSGFEAGKSEDGIEYVKFNNTWGYRNISRASSLKKSVRSFIKASKDERKAVIVYGAHTPYMEAAVYAKRLSPNIHICLVLPDLPQYMNLSKDRHLLYDFFKKIDIAKMRNLNASVDSYMLLTKYMKEAFEIGDRPYIIVEGISNNTVINNKSRTRGKTITYAGKLEESFGVKKLIEAFTQIEDEEARLIICGGGELVDYVQQSANSDGRIVYKGLVTAEVARNILNSSDILVNPRTNDNEYTKYSFPSKDIEYLQTGNIVVGYMLDGIPDIYADFIITPNSNSVDDLREALVMAINASSEEQTEKFHKAIDYLSKNCEKTAVAKRVVKMISEAMNDEGLKNNKN